MQDHTISTSPTRTSGNGAAIVNTNNGLLPAFFGTLQDVRIETRQLTTAVLQLIDESSKIGMRLAHRMVDRIDGLTNATLSAAERVTRAPLEVLQ